MKDRGKQIYKVARTCINAKLFDKGSDFFLALVTFHQVVQLLGCQVRQLLVNFHIKNT